MLVCVTSPSTNFLHTYTQALEGLLEGMNPPPSDPELFISFRDCHLLILKMIQSRPGLGPDVAMGMLHLSLKPGSFIVHTYSCNSHTI